MLSVAWKSVVIENNVELDGDGKDDNEQEEEDAVMAEYV